ncbi:MAG: lipid-A-disaccharide synthase [Crocinitomicaceae bacterium]
MKYFLIAGEASGDLHGSNLMRALKQSDANANFQYWGGDQMKSVDGKLKKHINTLAFMGFVEVLFNLRTILKNIKTCKNQIEAFKPDVLILIDYPGFNLRIANFAKTKGLRVHYYISPQIWAWKQNRVHKIKRVVDAMYTILPFEKEFYQKFNVEVDYVGHPLVDAIQDFKTKALSLETFRVSYDLTEQPILAVLPGSRNQEIKTKLPIMLAAAKAFNNYQVIIAGAPNKDKSFYHDIIGNEHTTIIENDTYNLLNSANLAMVTSGTATLETALFKVPQVVCYKANGVSYQIAKRLVKVKYISLVNLIMDKSVVAELIQDELTVSNIITELRKLENDNVEILLDYHNLEKILGGGGASKKVAELIYAASTKSK